MAIAVLCSTGVFSRTPGRTDLDAIVEFGPRLDAAGLELLLYPDWRQDAEGAAARLAATRLRFPVVHAEKAIGAAFSGDGATREAGLIALEQNCRLAQRLGAGLLVLHLWDLPDSDRRFERNLAALPRCLDLAAAHGLQLTIETVPCAVADPVANVQRAIERDGRCGVTLDTEFLAHHGQLEAALAAPWLWQDGRVRHLQIKDYDGALRDADGRRRYLQPGDGRIDFIYLFEVLREWEFSGTVSLEAAAVDGEGRLELDRVDRSLKLLRWLAAGGYDEEI
ncbi:MAG TPA: TIM barrel protein [Dehalococcoidia bacterium]|nr:TIM barrel protein [Dehalococcoidia bacterium]